MNDYLHRLASRVGFRTLGQQLALLFALLLTLSVGGYAVYVGLEQADFIEQLEHRHADELTTALAAALEPHVARGEATEIDQETAIGADRLNVAAHLRRDLLVGAAGEGPGRQLAVDLAARQGRPDVRRPYRRTEVRPVEPHLVQQRHQVPHGTVGMLVARVTRVGSEGREDPAQDRSGCRAGRAGA